MRSNQLRLWFAAMAYVLLAMATCLSLRLKLLKIGATVTRSTRRIKLAMAQGFPLQEAFAVAHARLAAAAARG